jgi:predicted DsbA family dithiol-disulfide isomerase
VRIDIWSDIVCPWCYIGKRRLERALAGFAAPQEFHVVHRSFQLNPDAPRDRTTDRAEGLKAKYGLSPLELQNMEGRLLKIAEGEGLDFHLDMQVSGNTFDAHRIVQLARERGVQGAAVERLFRAYFVEARSVFDAESLATLAVDAGLDAGETQRVLASDSYADAVLADRQQAAELDVRGVPFFVIDGRYAISGAQPIEIFRQALEQARGEVAPR